MAEDKQTAYGEPEEGMKMKRKWTIALRPEVGQEPRKITKIIGLNGDGFSVLTPYHSARSGYLNKTPIDPTIQGKYHVPWSEGVGFTIEDRAKLSYHTDGFAQFSSEAPGRIISGPDPNTGEPKGLGLFTNSLKNPIASGASVGVTVWGIDEFEEIQEGDDPLIFEPDDFYYRECTPDEANGWHLSIYAFPKNVVPPLRFRKGETLLEVALERLNCPLVSIVQLKIIYLPGETVFLGLFVNRVITNFPSKSGWTLNGPGDWTMNRRGHVLHGTYPRTDIPVQGRESLDRTPLAGSTDETTK